MRWSCTAARRWHRLKNKAYMYTQHNLREREDGKDPFPELKHPRVFICRANVTIQPWNESVVYIVAVPKPRRTWT